MAMCPICEREMLDCRVIGCDSERPRDMPLLFFKEDQNPDVDEGVEYDPVPFRPVGPMERCVDCGALKGQTHHLGCLAEDCPVCGAQLQSCGCFDSCMEHLFGDEDEDS